MKLCKVLPKLTSQFSRFCYVTHTLSHDTIFCTMEPYPKSWYNHFFYTSISVILGHGFPQISTWNWYKYRNLPDELLIFLTRAFLLPNISPKGLMQMKMLFWIYVSLKCFCQWQGRHSYTIQRSYSCLFNLKSWGSLFSLLWWMIQSPKILW